MENFVLVLAFVCPGIFGAAMATIAHLLFLRYVSSVKTVFTILAWFVGNGGAIAANGILFRIFQGPNEPAYGLSLIILGYLAGFGVTILVRQRSADSKGADKKILEAFFLLYGSGATGDKTQLCEELGVNEKELAQLNEVIIDIFSERSRKLFRKGGGK